MKNHNPENSFAKIFAPYSRNDDEIDSLRERLMDGMEEKLHGRTTEQGIIDAIARGECSEVVLALQGKIRESDVKMSYVRRVLPESIINAVLSYSKP